MTSPFLKKPDAAARKTAKTTATDAAPRKVSPPKKPAAKRATGRAAELYDLMLADLARSGLTAEDARAMRLEPYGRDERPDVMPPGAGYLVPYFDSTGKPRADLFRYRYLEDTRRKGFGALGSVKARRYTQPSGTPPGVYWAPFAEWRRIIETAEVPLIITEGEKKAAISSKMGVPCIGLGGVWSFRSKALGVVLLPELREVTWKDRVVYIVYDSDASRNTQVCAAENALAQELTRQGASVRIVRLPDQTDGTKTGLDDYLVSQGTDALLALCDATEVFAMSVELHKLNSEVLYIRDPGIVLVRGSHQIMRPSDFTNHAFADRQYPRVLPGKDGTPKMELRQTAADWIKWPQRATAQSIVFSPGEDEVTPEGRYNLWRGWPYAPKRGDVKPWRELLDFLCDGSPIARSYVEKWLAYPIQNPGVKMRNAVVFWGLGKGTGKSQIGYTIGDLYGDAFWEIDDSHIEGTVSFNEWARNRHFVMGDEITGNSARRVANRIKNMITREKVEVNIKNVPQYRLADCINYYFTAQHPDCFYLEEGDRRYFVHEVKAFKPLEDEFYRAYDKWRRSDAGRQALMYHLMYNIDTADFNPMAAPPITEDKLAMIDNTRSELEAWLREVRGHPEVVCRRFGNCDLVSSQELAVLYEAEGHPKLSAQLIGRKLKIAGIPAMEPKDLATAQILINGKLVRLYALRNASHWAKCGAEKLRAEYMRARSIVEEGGKKKF